MTFTDAPGLFDEADRVHVSVAFTWDLSRAEWLARQWERVAPVELGGPATGQRGEGFLPGRYLKPGYVITSRGCPNRCWFCDVWRRDGPTRELPIRDGWNVLDDNLLACSEHHVRDVFTMLRRQKQRAQFTGGLEAARLRDWHVDLLAGLKPRPSVFFAYDTPDDHEPLAVAARKMFAAGFTTASHNVRCYVLVGYPGDTMDKADDRLRKVLYFGITPAAMLYRGKDNAEPSKEWRAMQRSWFRPAVIHAKRSE